MATAKKTKGAPSDVMGFLGYYLGDNAPIKLPKGLKELIVKFAPIASLVLGILTAFGALTYLGVSSLFGSGIRDLGITFVNGAFLVIVAVMYLMAYVSLKARKLQGWTLIFVIEVISIVRNVLSGDAILNTVLGAVVAFYFLFQIRGYYKK